MFLFCLVISLIVKRLFRLNSKFNHFSYVKSEDQKKIPLFCMCSYERDCSLNEKMHLSIQYATQLEKENREKGLNRGADYQCENVLKAKTKLKHWTCTVKGAKHFTSSVTPVSAHSKKKFAQSENQLKQNNDELYCDCFHKKKCKHNRMVDFYD